MRIGGIVEKFRFKDLHMVLRVGLWPYFFIKPEKLKAGDWVEAVVVSFWGMGRPRKLIEVYELWCKTWAFD